MTILLQESNQLARYTNKWSRMKQDQVARLLEAAKCPFVRERGKGWSWRIGR